MKSYEVGNYVDVEQNLTGYPLEQVVSVCKRKNNTKRDFLFVNHLQGKHIPVSPKKSLNLMRKLGNYVSSELTDCGNIAVIGFAETATAIGQIVASCIENCTLRLQTTREKIENTEPLIRFEEEHSHATSQMLYCDLEKLKSINTLVFVDDEITTGNTILNFIEAIENLGLQFKYVVASFLNWQSNNYRQIFQDREIETISLVKGTIKDIYAKVPVGDSKLTTPTQRNYKDTVLKLTESNNFNFKKERMGGKPLTRLGANLDEELNNLCLSSNSQVLVLGTEEFMTAGLLFAEKLESQYSCHVRFQATTRSPIQDVAVPDYAINECIQLPSVYDLNRNTYLYNINYRINLYTDVIIVTDTLVPVEVIEQLETIFYESQITIIKIKEGICHEN